MTWLHRVIRWLRNLARTRAVPMDLAAERRHRRHWRALCTRAVALDLGPEEFQRALLEDLRRTPSDGDVKREERRASAALAHHCQQIERAAIDAAKKIQAEKA